MISRSITMQKYDHPVAVYESSPKNNQTKLNNSQLRSRKKCPKPPSANRKHSSPSHFFHHSDNPDKVISAFRATPATVLQFPITPSKTQKSTLNIYIYISIYI